MTAGNVEPWRADRRLVAMPVRMGTIAIEMVHRGAKDQLETSDALRRARTSHSTRSARARHQQIRKASQKCRHNQKEDHQKGVGSDDHIVDATHKGKSQLDANSQRKKGAIDTGVNCKEEIEAAHLFWIG